jgi:hypothetical protein
MGFAALYPSSAGGTLLCAILGALTLGILARIDQGFAVFG